MSKKYFGHVRNRSKRFDLLLFNRGDGTDLVAGGTDADNVISLGGGIIYADLRLGISGNDLIFFVGPAEQLTLKDWYADSAHRSVGILQMIIADPASNDPGAGSVIHQKMVQWFDFDAMVDAFDVARAADGSITAWSLTEVLLTEEYIGGSNESAYGGDLAWMYATEGTLAGQDMQSAQTVLSDASFGVDVQSLHEAVLLEGIPLLM